jgi:hypothetical protein
VTDAMSPDREALYHRVVDVVSGFDATPDERDQILAGTGPAESWADVPQPVKDLIVKIENSPRQVWDDPADLPEQQNL